MVAPEVILDDPFLVHPQYPSSLAYMFPLTNKSYAHESLDPSPFTPLTHNSLPAFPPTWRNTLIHKFAQENEEIGADLNLITLMNNTCSPLSGGQRHSHILQAHILSPVIGMFQSISMLGSLPFPMDPQSSWI